MKIVTIMLLSALLASLAGCAAIVPDYAPNIVAFPGHEQQAKDDKSFCDKVVADRRAEHSFTWNSVKKVASGGGQGLGSNLSSAAVGNAWIGPTLGAVGGAGTAALQEFEIIDSDSPQTMQSCLLQMRNDDHSFVLGEPMMGGNQP